MSDRSNSAIIEIASIVGVPDAGGPETVVKRVRDLVGQLAAHARAGCPQAAIEGNGLDKVFGIAPELPEPCADCGEASCECSSSVGVGKTLGEATPEREPEIPNETGAPRGKASKPLGATATECRPGSERPLGAPPLPVVTESLSGQDPGRPTEGALGARTYVADDVPPGCAPEGESELEMQDRWIAKDTPRPSEVQVPLDEALQAMVSPDPIAAIGALANKHRTKEAVPDLEHLGPFAREAWDPVGGRPVNPDHTAQWTNEEVAKVKEEGAKLYQEFGAPRPNEAWRPADGDRVRISPDCPAPWSGLPAVIVGAPADGTDDVYLEAHGYAAWVRCGRCWLQPEVRTDSPLPASDGHWPATRKQMTRSAYDALVAEDLAWLDKQPSTLESRHIRAIVQASIEGFYGEQRTEPARSDVGTNLLADVELIALTKESLIALYKCEREWRVAFQEDARALLAEKDARTETAKVELPKSDDIVAARDALDRMWQAALGNDYINEGALRQDYGLVEGVLDTVEMAIPLETGGEER